MNRSWSGYTNMPTMQYWFWCLHSARSDTGKSEVLWQVGEQVILGFGLAWWWTVFDTDKVVILSNWVQCVVFLLRDCLWELILHFIFCRPASNFIVIDFPIKLYKWKLSDFPCSCRGFKNICPICFPSRAVCRHTLNTSWVLKFEWIKLAVNLYLKITIRSMCRVHHIPLYSKHCSSNMCIRHQMFHKMWTSFNTLCSTAWKQNSALWLIEMIWILKNSEVVWILIAHKTLLEYSSLFHWLLNRGAHSRVLS